MSTNKSKYIIISGPDINAILKSFRYTNDKKKTTEIGFSIIEANVQSTYVPMQVRNISIRSLAYANDSNNNIMVIKGQCKANLGDITNHNYEDFTFIARYNPDYDQNARKGTISLFR